MAAPSVTNTFANSTTSDASEVNTNFTDLVNALGDGSKDITINALTCAGAVVCNGNVTVGNATSDDFTVTGSLASTVNIKTTASYDLGTTTKGMNAIFFGANSETVNIKGSGSMSATWTLTLPITAGSDGEVLATNGSGVTVWQNKQMPHGVENIGISTSVGSSALTVNLLGADGNALSSTNAALVSFRNSTVTTGLPVLQKLTAAPTSLVISSGSTLGFTSGQKHYAYVYLVDDGGTVKIGISKLYLDEGELHSSTADNGSGGSDSGTVLYTANGIAAATSKAIRLIGRITFSLSTAGTWDEAGDEVSLIPFKNMLSPTVQKYTSGSGTYTTPTSPSPVYLKVTMVGGGGGGGGSGTSSGTAAGAGGESTFGTSSLLDANGGALGARGAQGAAGGTATVSAPAIGTALSGGNGEPSLGYGATATTGTLPGGTGGSSVLGGGGVSGTSLVALAGTDGTANTGGGGGGACAPDSTNNAQSGAGGGGGGYISAIIPNPGASYAYAVGAGGSGQAAGSGGAAGGAGAAGYIIVEEYYQ